MNVGYTPNSFGWLLLLIFGSFIIFPLLLLLTRLLLQLFGIRNNGLMLAVFFGSICLVLFSMSLALDMFGEQVAAQIVSKRETVTVDRSGDWRHSYLLSLQLDAKSLPLPMPSGVDSTLLESFLKDTGTQFSSYSPDDATYDRFDKNDAFALRVLRIGGLSITRPISQSTFTVLPWGWLLAGFVVLGLFVMFWRNLWWGAVLIAVMLLITLPIMNANQAQRTVEDNSDKTERITAIVQNSHRITEWDFVRSRRSHSEYELRQPYEIVEFQFTPRGARSPVIGIDAIDVAANAPPPFTKGQTVEVRYAPDEPRDVRVDGYTRSWPWRDMVGVYIDSALYIGVIVFVLLAFLWFGRGRKKSKSLTPQAQ